jgi:riboflavin synthase
LRRSSTSGLQIQIAAPAIAKGAHRGDSIALNGCCLTVANHRNEFIVFDLLQETLDRTNLRHLRPDAVVNLERPLLATGRLGGHFVQGHIDCSTRILAYEKKGDDYRLDVELPPEYAHLIVPKGSVAISGISLTVGEIHSAHFTVWIIPHTRKATNLHTAKAGDFVNLEFDVLAKYVDRMLFRSAPTTTPPHFTDRDLSEG